MNSIKILDVTLRDGGCVNNFNFGLPYMQKIMEALEQSSVDIIELGYIDENKGSEIGRTQYLNEKVIYKNFLHKKSAEKKYVAMIDYGKFDIDKLEMKNGEGIDGIRMAFHKKNRKDVLCIGKKIIEKGYDFYIQPMITMRYSDYELLDLINDVNTYLPNASGFYIVDSFGEMRGNDVVRLMHLIDQNLIKSMALGFHSHNNLQLSYSNSMALLSFTTNRDLILDSSVMGMGKGAGNLNTELLMEHLNLYYGKNYHLQPLLALIDSVISVLHKENYWGYSVEYYLSSINHCTPSYASHFYNKHILPIDQVAELLSMISEDKKISFDKEYADKLYIEYNSNKSCDDKEVVASLNEKFKNKKIFLIAPGKSIAENRDKIISFLNKDDIISISLNNFEYTTDFYLITRKELMNPAVSLDKKILSTLKEYKENKNVHILNYKKWISIKDGFIYDGAGIIALNLLSFIEPLQIFLAGFDGFDSDMNNNYFDASLRHQITVEQARSQNEFYKSIITQIPKVSFVTKSLYEEGK